MSIACAALMCHAPIVIPTIGGERAEECRETTNAMREAARALVEHGPEVLVLISPHSPRDRVSWGISEAQALHGSFARFGHGRVQVSVKGAPDASRTLALIAAERGLATHMLAPDQLDHGALVPLYFVREAGFEGSVLLIALPYPDAGTEVAFGEAIEAAARARGERWAVLASGDMSHRLTPDAPAGFDPVGRKFDQEFVSHLRRGDVRAAIELPRELVARAGEDVVQSTAVAAGAIGFDTRGLRLLGYEGPFGVGYCEALLHAETSQHAPPRALVDIALAAIDATLREVAFTPPPLSAPWERARPVFVTLRSPDGTLRGCIGRTLPLARTLAEEVADCAVSAATRDPRVPPITSNELDALQVEVSVLRPAERVDSRAELDPRTYGVVVTYGPRRGVLLPAIEGVDTVDDQLRIVLRKAGISSDAPYRIERFAVDKVARHDLGVS